MKRRAGLVQRAVADWKTALVDLGGRNNLLHYRDLKRGTLDLTVADSGAVSDLLLGKSVRVSALFADPEERDQVLRRVRVIHNKAKENFEERGLQTLSIGCGLASWENKRRTWAPCAPVLLQPATLRPLGASQDEFELAVIGETMEVNPTLLHVLKTDFGCEVDHAALMARIPDGIIDELWELRETYAWIAEQAHAVPGFRVEQRMVLANFAYAKLAMVNDLDGAFEELVAHDLIAALAGDEQAREAIRAQGPGPEAIPGPDQVPLADEFLVLDADASQNYATNAVLAGQSLIVKGPPGTGKSQTIANLIGSLVARGKKVLFVAEKRAAIDAVTKRLNQQKLGELVLDLHGGVSSRRAFAQSVGRALAVTRNAPRLDNGWELALVEKRREQLNAYVQALHGRRDPWGLSVYEIRAQLIGLGQADTGFRFRGRVIERLSGTVARRAEEDLAGYARLGGLTLTASETPWSRSPIVSAEEARRADEALDEVRRHMLPNTLALLGRASEETGLPAPGALASWATSVELWTQAGSVQLVMAPAIYELDLQADCQALAAAGRGGAARLWAALTSGEYRAARSRLRAAVAGGRTLADRELYSLAVTARDTARRWAELGGRGSPQAPRALTDCQASYQHLLDGLARLEAWAGRPGLAELPTEDCQRALDQLDADRGTLAKLHELHRLRTSLDAAGAEEFLAGMTARQASEEFAVQSFRYAWLSSILDHLALTDLSVESFSADAQDKAVGEFKTGDREHIETTPTRIRRLYAENTVRVRDEFKDQAALVLHQAGLKRRHMPVRDFVRNAADVLLALKPCWAMSPLVVSQLLPAHPYFDVVIFDEASQITPADAVTSILRGKQLVVAGDDKQLPPSAWFVSDSTEDDSEADPELPVPLIAGTSGFESILNAVGSLLRFRTLCWHYRSRDERLIAFSNAHIYDWTLTTFPGIGGSDVLRYVPAPWDPTADTNSPAPEVNTAVDLILDHARQRPTESLGVITMGIRHSDRIEECLRQRLRDDPRLAEQLAEFFDENREERFFVKNLERVQGDERDAIILSIGYGKNARGDLVYRFGPLLTEGGERRLNVAVTRAKNRVTLVSSFSARDMDPERSTAEGVTLMRQYLQYVESGGTNLGDHVLDKPALNPFEIDVRDTLSRHGLKLTPQYGVSGYWIDFAVQHPLHPGRYVLAIECDGATYHSSRSARDRDRLRQEQLERHGWRFHRIWSSEWFYHKDACAQKAIAAYHDAVRDSDNGIPATGSIQRPAPSTSVRETDEGGAATPLHTTYEAALSRSPSGSAVPRGRAGARPWITRGYPIDTYSDAELLKLAQWITSDDVLRTEDELFQEMMRELGFQRRGKNVVARLTTAISRSRAQRPEPYEAKSEAYDDRPAWMRDGLEATLVEGDDDLEVVGESHYQDNLWRLVGGRCRPGAQVRCEIHALLVAEDNNPYDPNAIAVWVEGLIVGHLSRQDARRYRPGLLALQERYGKPVALAGVIAGGGTQSDGPGSLGVFLRHDLGEFGLRAHGPGGERSSLS
jgi:very-short-patch-repair endonuclease